MSENKNRKRSRNHLPDAQGEGGPASPPGPPGARGSSSPSRASKLLGGMPPSQPGDRHATSLPGGLPGVLIAPWRRTQVPRLHFPPPELSHLPLPLVFVATQESPWSTPPKSRSQHQQEAAP